MNEATLLSWIPNQGLAIAIACFLVWFLAQQITKTQEKLVDTLIKHDTKSDAACLKIDRLDEKLDKIYDVVVGK